ncbi:MAG: aldehyde dehydrogenase family protein, partial [Rhodoluna sp.]
MALKQLKNFVNGEYVEAKSGQTSDIFDPATGKPYATAQLSNAADIDNAYKVADKAFETWSQTTPGERQLALFRIADALEARAEEMADVESQNTGKPRSSLVENEILVSVDQIRFFAGAARNLQGIATAEYAKDHTSSIRREPIGVI